MQPFGAQNIIKSVIFKKPEDASYTQVCQKTRKSFYSSNSKLLWKKSFDNRILNTMDSKIETIMEVLNGAKVSPVDSARYIRNILDAKPINSGLTDVQFISKFFVFLCNRIKAHIHKLHPLTTHGIIFGRKVRTIRKKHSGAQLNGRFAPYGILHSQDVPIPIKNA